MAGSQGYAPLPEVGGLNDQPSRCDSSPRASTSRSSVFRRSTEIDDSKEQKVARIISSPDSFNRSDDEVEELTPEEAFHNLLAYLRIDPDGGIMNLADENQDFGTEQVTKIHIILERDAIRIFLSVTLLLRVMVNVPQVCIVSAHAVFCYFSPSCPAHLTLGLAKECKLPLALFVAAISAFELCRGSLVLLQTLRDLFTFMCTRDESDPETGSRLVHRRYVNLARLFWEDLQQLQNFSALSCLGAVHPALIGHYAKELTARDDAARALFERMFGKDEHALSDAHLHELVVKMLINAEHKNDGEQIQKSLALKYTELASFQLLQRLRQLKELPESSIIADRMAIADRAWRVLLVAHFESFAFWGWSIFLLVFGIMAFLVKMCRVAVVLFDPEAEYWHMLYVTLVFVNQVLGIMSVSQLLRWRIFRFLFGGHDARISSEELYLMHMYQALLAEKIWTTKASGASLMRKVIAMLSLNDDDIQRLVVEESDSQKTHVAHAIKKIMPAAEIRSQSVAAALLGRSFPWIRGKKSTA